MRKNRIVKIEKKRNDILSKDRLSVTLQNELRRSKSFSIMRGDGLQNPSPRMTQSLRSRDLNEVLRLQQQRDSDECDSYPSPTQSLEQRRGKEQGRERESSEWDGVQSQDDVRASLYSDQSIPSEEPFAFEMKIRDELKLTILTMARQHAAEREALAVQIETLKDKIGVLTTQNKNLSSSSSSTLPVLFVPSLSPRRNDSLEGQKDKETGAGMGTRSVGGGTVDDNVHNNRTYNDNNKDDDKDFQIEFKNVKYALSVEVKKNDSLTALLDAAKSKILSLTSQLSHDRSMRSSDGKKDKHRERERGRVRDSSTSPLPSSLAPPLPLSLPLPSPGDPNISNVTVEDVDELQAKLRWSGRHHTIMCRAVLLLERYVAFHRQLLLLFILFITFLSVK